MSLRRIRTAILALSLGLVTLVGGSVAHAGPTITNDFITSNAPDHIQIGYTLFQPDGADATHPVPFVLHSHGWGGSRTKTGFTDWLNDGFGVLSFDQRGWGQSGGQANVEDPALEGLDVEAVVDFIGNLPWVLKDGIDDPVMGSIGGSYGGGYQTIGSLTEIKNKGYTRFNALAPEITWFDLPESLAPQGVVRSTWNAVLYAAGASHVPNFIHESFAYGLATNQFPDGTLAAVPNLKEIFYEHSPRWFSDNGFHLNVPVLFRQGITDNLFNLNQAWHNYSDVLTDGAKANSFLIGYNGGHVLPEVAPLSSNPGNVFATSLNVDDNCSGDGGFAALTRKFFKEVFAGTISSSFMPKHFNLSANDGATCLSTNSMSNWTPYPVQPAGVIATNTTAGAPVAYKLADGPMTVTGISRLRGKLTAAGVDTRAFFALSVGTTAADAKVVQNNLMPLRSLLPVVQQDFTIELPGVAVDVPAGQSLYLTVSPFQSMSLSSTSRTPGAILIQDAVVDVPKPN